MSAQLFTVGIVISFRKTSSGISLLAQCTPYDASGNQLLLRRTWHPSPNIYLSDYE
ncbi:hypothetical protein KC19_12G134500 [Ceratodon purpureus]|uniref:Uncharacterized protein n=1 Tax=Ceratodon purpureus TaxID=3225 RepID=A0A8T0G935_CERPU|nr:hypothetical protein KC19_12G134500 [Ceratodon purpureus]